MLCGCPRVALRPSSGQCSEGSGLLCGSLLRLKVRDRWPPDRLDAEGLRIKRRALWSLVWAALDPRSAFCRLLVSYRPLAHEINLSQLFTAAASSRLAGHRETRPGLLCLHKRPTPRRAAPRRVKPASRVTRGERHTDDRGAPVTDQKMGSKQQVPDGMLIGPKNPIIEEALGDRLIKQKIPLSKLDR